MNEVAQKHSLPGPWDTEPDTKNFEVEGLPCVMSRGPSGHWCGYVGIPEGHRLYGKDYTATVKVPPEILERPIDVDKVGVINVFCAGLSDSEAMKDGYIDIVLAFDVHGGLTWARDEPAGGVDHPDGYWWFGFDCAHVGDLSPKYDTPDEHHVYRDAEYVEGECASLARQLVAFS